MKRFILPTALLVFSMSPPVHAGGLGGKLIGKWQGKQETTEFLKGGMFVAIQGKQKAAGKYTIQDGNILAVSVQGQEGICKADVKGNKLIFSTEYDCPWSGETLTRLK